MSAFRVSDSDQSPEAVAKRVAEDDEVATLMHQHLLASAFEHGEASGFAKSYLARAAASLDKEALGEEAYDAALAEAHRVVINEICQILGIMIDVPKLERLDSLDLPQLVEVKDNLLQRDVWPAWMYAPKK